MAFSDFLRWGLYLDIKKEVNSKMETITMSDDFITCDCCKLRMTCTFHNSVLRLIRLGVSIVRSV